jgi:hypothetical protein
MKKIIKLTESQLKRIIKEQVTKVDSADFAILNQYKGETANIYSDPQNKKFVTRIDIHEVFPNYYDPYAKHVHGADEASVVLTTKHPYGDVDYLFRCNKPTELIKTTLGPSQSTKTLPAALINNELYYSNNLTTKLKNDFCTLSTGGASVPNATFSSAKTQTSNLAENKKPIRLTEADLADLVKRVMEEGDRFAYGTDAIRNLEKDMAPDEDVRLTDYTGELRGDVLKKKDYIIQWLRDIIHNEDWNRLGDVILYMKHRM